MPGIRLKRVYEAPARADGARVLVDRVWPRGVSKEAARLDRWLKEVAPSAALRKWFGHEPSRWEEFRRRYHAELEKGAAAQAVEELRDLLKQRRTVTLLFAARDEAHNNAVALKAFLEG